MQIIRNFSLVLALMLTSALTARAEGLTASIHTIQPGETLAVIAQHYGVSVASLSALNGIEEAHIIYSWRQLLIPSVGRPVGGATSRSSTQTSAAGTYSVQRGDTIFSIARQHGITAEALMEANGIADPHMIHSGLTLRLVDLEAPAPASSEIPAAPETPAQAPAVAAAASAIVLNWPSSSVYPAGGLGQYIVRRGEYLTELGVRFNMEWMLLAEFNDISAPYTIHPGQSLRVPTFAEYLSLLPANSSYRLFYTTNHHPGPRVGVGREIVIELGRQSIYAYENGVLKKRAIMSSGKVLTPTVRGDYKIYHKVRSQTMNGPDYSLDNVKWPMYFHKGYAIHGTWWHTMFGTPMSHGCVNLTNEDARWFYKFAPIGTPVHVRY